MIVVSGELAEGWIYGVGSDPHKLQQMRELARARDAWVAAGVDVVYKAAVDRFTLLTTKNSEHTWGIHNAVVNKTALVTNWDNKAFHAAKMQGNPYAGAERAWRQQRTFGLDAAVASLKGTLLHDDVLARMKALAPFSPQESQPASRSHIMTSQPRFKIAPQIAI